MRRRNDTAGAKREEVLRGCAHKWRIRDTARIGNRKAECRIERARFSLQFVIS